MSTPDERALAFLTARIQEKQLSNGVPSNFNQFVADTSLEAAAHFGTVEPVVKAKIIEDASSDAGKAWLREHKELMKRLKTDASAPKPKAPTVARPKLTGAETAALAAAATKARFNKEKRDAKRSKMGNEVDARWKDLKKTDGPVDGPD